MDFNFSPSIEQMPNAKASVAFVLDSGTVFREDTALDSRVLRGGQRFIPWGMDNQMPYNIISKIEDDETLARAYRTTCAQIFAFKGENRAQWAATLSNQKLFKGVFDLGGRAAMALIWLWRKSQILRQSLALTKQFNAEVCYGAGLQYNTEHCTPEVQDDIEDFLLQNDLAGYFLGVCQDFKYFGFCVSVIIFNKDGSRIVRIVRKVKRLSRTEQSPVNFARNKCGARVSKVPTFDT